MSKSVMHPPYTSVEKPVYVDQIIKKSRFIASVFTVEEEADTLAALQEVRSQYPDSSHICYAYKYGLESEVVRFNDAGEPSGTAGRPILEVIDREGLRNTLVVVTRYFGGILLGAGGLVRAYAGSAAMGIAAAGKAAYAWHFLYRVNVDYQTWSRVERLLRDAGYEMTAPEYAASVSLECRVLPANVDAWSRMLQDAAGGQAQINLVGEGYEKLSSPAQ